MSLRRRSSEIPAGRRLAVTALAVLFLPAPGVPAQTPPLEVWVVTRDAAEIRIIDPATNLVDPVPVDISDPDGDGTAETPAGGLCFSTAPASAGTHAFVTYEEGVLAVIEVATRRIVRSVNLAGVLSGSSCQPGVVRDVLARGCAASVPRRFAGTAGPTLRSYLHVAATVGGSTATAVMLDQDALISGAAPLVDCETMRQDAVALAVETLENPHGDLHHRAWYTMRGDSTPEELEAVLVATGPTLPAALSAAARRSTTLPAGAPAPDVFHGVGAPHGREAPVWSQFSAGDLVNLDLGGSCSPGGDLVAVDVTGVGPHAYEVWAVDLVSRQLVLVDPIDCSTDPVGVGRDPLDVAFLGPVHWQAAFVVNRGSDDVSRVDADRTVTTIALGSGGPACTECPIAIGVANQAICDIELTLVEKRDVNPPNGVVDTIRLEWEPIGCPDDIEFLVECICMDDDPACPCKCNCNEFPDVCECPGFEIGAFTGDSLSGEPDGNHLPLIPKVPWPISPDDSWIPLGVTSDLFFDHLVPEGNSSGVGYDLKPNDL